MFIIKTSYTIYKRNDKYMVCDSSYNHYLEKNEIYKTGIESYSKASQIVRNLNFNELINK